VLVDVVVLVLQLVKIVVVYNALEVVRQTDALLVKDVPEVVEILVVAAEIVKVAVL
jgi:hypothetical protein